MVYEKVRSGDPDYDDKQPIEHHIGPVVSAGDGVFLSKVGGPVDANGAHVNLVVDTADLDNRPSPGNVATAASEVQDYTPEETPTDGQASDADVQEAADGQALVSKPASKPKK